MAARTSRVHAVVSSLTLILTDIANAWLGEAAGLKSTQVQQRAVLEQFLSIAGLRERSITARV